VSRQGVEVGHVAGEVIAVLEPIQRSEFLLLATAGIGASHLLAAYVQRAVNGEPVKAPAYLRGVARDVAACRSLCDGLCEEARGRKVVVVVARALRVPRAGGGDNADPQNS